MVYAPPPPARRKRRLFALPYLGVHSWQNSEAAGYEPGARFGVMLGGRLSDVWSLNGEMSFDISNVARPPSGITDYSEWTLDLAFSPMFQVPAGSVEFALGPKFGIFVLENHGTDAGGAMASGQLSGYLVGINVGLFVPLSPQTSLGVLLSYEQKWADHACVRVGGVAEQCGTVTGSHTAEILGLTGAALF
jgi:hypothetical protein